ncbi:hypothetical protein E2C01_091346 [Portunus trituberculatus]|uniref:Uncharacterized protein n=1 Tax=Portunus trituberculatus TaxID=210409 RepID=A0A5B7JSP4_PORTR|nr:hypothetical protein [Portunus trituberculatus]
MANLTTPDYNWDLKMRATFPSPQLVQNPCPGKWCWDKDEVLSSHTSKFFWVHQLYLCKSILSCTMVLI